MRRLTGTIVILCAILSFLTYCTFDTILSNDFIEFDDGLYITNNAAVQSGLTWTSFKYAFQTFDTGNWIPLTWLSHMLDVEISDLNPRGHHLVNLILHIANTLLVFLLVYRTTGRPWASFLAAALFALHPLRVESVAWASERKDTLSTLFGLSALLSYVAYTQHRQKHAYVLTAVLLICGLMAKPMLVTWPFLFLLLDHWPLKRLRRDPSVLVSHNRQLITEKFPFFVIVAVFSVVAYWSQNAENTVISRDVYPVSFRLQNIWISYASYLKMIFFPSSMGVLYPLNRNADMFLKCCLALALLAGLTFVFFRFRKNKPYLLTGWLWFLGTLVPVIGLVQIGMQSIADRYTYVPSIGLSILIAFLIADWAAKKPATKYLLVGFTAVIIATLIVQTWIQTAYWKDSITLYTHTLDVTSDNPTMQLNLGCAYANKKEFEKAAVHLRKANELNPGSATPLERLAQIAITETDFDAALGYLKAAITKQDADEARDCFSFAACYNGLEQYDLAITWLEKGIELNPSNTAALTTLAETYQKKGLCRKTLECYNRALSLNKNSWFVLNKLANFYMDKDNPLYSPAKALEHAQMACRVTDFKHKPSLLILIGILEQAKQLEASLQPDFLSEVNHRVSQIKDSPD